MRKLELAVTGLCWVFSLSTYVLLAAWVGQGSFDTVCPDGINGLRCLSGNEARFFAVFLGVFWAAVSGAIIHAWEIPKSIVRTIMDDDQ